MVLLTLFVFGGAKYSKATRENDEFGSWRLKRGTMSNIFFINCVHQHFRSMSIRQSFLSYYASREDKKEKLLLSSESLFHYQ